MVHEPPTPPPLPPGQTIVLPGRGEIFARVTTTPDGVMPVLLLHGWTASADTNWFPLFDALDGQRPLVAPDHRGHGRGLRPEEPFSLEDCADDAAELLRVLGIKRAVVCGYSMGGPISMLLWKRHPDLVHSLVLGATALEWRAARGGGVVLPLLPVLGRGRRVGVRGPALRPPASQPVQD